MQKKLDGDRATLDLLLNEELVKERSVQLQFNDFIHTAYRGLHGRVLAVRAFK